MKFKSRSSEKVEMQLTSMIDVIFLLLIFFVMTFFTIGMMSNFKRLAEEGIVKLALVYVVCLFGFIIGIMSNNFEQMQIIPMLVVTPLTFLGGAFYSISMLAPFWQGVAHFNPVVYLISGFRWSFFGKGDVGIEISSSATNIEIRSRAHAITSRPSTEPRRST